MTRIYPLSMPNPKHPLPIGPVCQSSMYLLCTLSMHILSSKLELDYQFYVVYLTVFMLDNTLFQRILAGTTVTHY